MRKKMKILFCADVILDLLKDQGYSNDVRKLLYACQKGICEGYITNIGLYNLETQIDSDAFSQTISILKVFLQLIDLNCTVLIRAGKKGEFYAELYQLLYKKYGIDFIACKRKKKTVESTIRVTDPEDLRKILENGKTD